MEEEQIKKEILENGTRKINIGVRAYSELKLKLTDESKALGVSLSEYCENILITHPGLLEESNFLKAERDNLIQQIVDLKEELSKVNLSEFNTKIKMLTEDNSIMKKEIMHYKSNQQIYSDPRLLYLLKQVKGMSDTIITDKGELIITFNTTKDVLLGLIYSFKF